MMNALTDFKLPSRAPSKAPSSSRQSCSETTTGTKLNYSYKATPLETINEDNKKLHHKEPQEAKDRFINFSKRHRKSSVRKAGVLQNLSLKLIMRRTLYHYWIKRVKSEDAIWRAVVQYYDKHPNQSSSKSPNSPCDYMITYDKKDQILIPNCLSAFGSRIKKGVSVIYKCKAEIEKVGGIEEEKITVLGQKLWM